jgi:hypothetical protein
VAGEVAPKQTIRAIIIFDAAEDAKAFCIKGRRRSPQRWRRGRREV